MKICIVRTAADVLNSYSYNLQEVGLAKELLKYNISADIIMSGGCIKQYSMEKVDDVTIYRLPSITMPGNTGLFLSIFSFLRENKYDVIQVQDDIYLFSCLVAFWAHKRHVSVVLCQGVYRNYEGFLPSIYQWLYDATFLKYLASSTSLCIAKTSHAKDYLLKKKFNKEIVVVPIGLDVQKFSDQTTIDWKSKLNLDENIDILLYVGRIESRRNIQFLIEVFMEVFKVSRAYLILAGDGPDKCLCERKVNESNMRKYIKFIGQVPQSHIISLYKTASLFLLPSAYEIYGMVVLESMYCGVPVISSATAGAMSIITDKTDGVIIEDFRVDIWKREIVSLLNNHELRKRYASNAKEKVGNSLTWSVLAQYYADIYKNITRE